MKKMLFIIPWSDYYVNKAYCTFSDYPERAPEGVVQLASFLQINGIEVKIADMQRILRGNNGKCDSALTELWSICTVFNPDVIGFSFFTARFEFAKEIFEYLKIKFEQSDMRPLLIAGGVHPTLMPEITMQNIPFDALIIGEGELPLLELLSQQDWKEIQNIAGIYTNDKPSKQHGKLIDNLDSIPFPNWSLIDKDYYSQPSHQLPGKELQRVMPISFSRGCKYRCNFCAHSCFLKARSHSPNYFIQMMDSVAEQCKVDTFILQDSSIGNFKKDWSEVCLKLIDRKTPYRWWANLRANQVDEEFLRLMRDAGCIMLFFGFESGSQRILDKMGKRISVEQCRQVSKLCHKLNIRFYTSYIINYWGETAEDLRKTEQLILESQPSLLAINKFSPIPGSHDYNENRAIVEPLIQTMHDWTNLGMLNLSVNFGDMSSEEYMDWEQHFRYLKRKLNAHEGIED